MIFFTQYDSSNYSAYKSIKIVYQETNSFIQDILYFILAYIDVKYLITHKLLIF